MVHRREVALDDPAAKYLPEHVRMPARSGKSITLLDLATNTSGLPNFPNLKANEPGSPHPDYSVDDLYKFLSGYELSRDPGSEFEYSNLGVGRPSRPSPIGTYPCCPVPARCGPPRMTC